MNTSAPDLPPEELDRERLEACQLARLDALLAAALPGSRFLARRLGVERWEPGRLGSLRDLRDLPLTTRAELAADQAEHPPYGTIPALPRDRYVRLFQTSGTASGRPLRWLYDRPAWEAVLDCWRRIFAAARVGARDTVFFPFSFGPFLGFWAAYEGADRLGALCLPGGGMSSAARLRFLLDNAVTTVCCTPTYALRLAEVAAAEGLDLAASPVRALLVAGEPGGSLPAVRSRIEAAWGARCHDHSGMTEAGSLGIEFHDEPGVLRLLETHCIAEVIDAETGRVLDDVAERTEGGELVLTSLGNAAMPLLRYRTGDFVRLDRRPSPATGRALARLVGGIRGRIDDMLLIKGNNVYPSAIEEVVREAGGVAEFLIEVWQRPEGTRVLLRVEPLDAAAGAGLAGRLREALRDRLQFSAAVEVEPAGSLPRFEMKARRLVVHDEIAPSAAAAPR